MKNVGWALGMAAGIAAGVSFGLLWSSPSRAGALDAGPRETQWEYRLEPKAGTPIDRPTNNDHLYQKFFDTLGKDGWEYVGSFGGGENRGPAFALVFRRPKQ